ncbi:tetratricopeptide repeat protein [bacterium]|nr:tetratricopeptide repeat protein [bacterium]
MNTKLIKVINKLISFCLPMLAFLIVLSFYLKTYDSCQIKITLLQFGGIIFFSLWLIKIIEMHSSGNDFPYSFPFLNYLTIPVICFLFSALLSYSLSHFKFTSLDELIKRILYTGIFLVIAYEADRKESIKLFFWPVMIAIFLVLTIFNKAIFSVGMALNVSMIKAGIVFLCITGIGTLLYKDRKEANIDKVIRWIIFAAFLAVLYGFLQYFNKSTLSLIVSVRKIVLKFLMEPHLDPFVWRNAFGYRIFSTFGNPNFFAAFLVLVSPLIFMEFLRTKKNKYLIIFLMNTLSIILAVTKASWVGFAAASMACVILSVIGLRLKIKLKKVLIAGVIVINILAVFGVTYYSRKRIDSLRFRLFTWASTIQMIKQHPVLGSGLGTFKITYPAYRRSEIFHIEGKHNTETDHPENEFLEIWYDQGIVGLIIFLWMLFAFFSTGIRKIKQLALSRENTDKKLSDDLAKDEYYLIGILSGLFGLLVHNLMCVNMRFVSSGFFFWLFLGLAANIILKAKKETAVLDENTCHFSKGILIRKRLCQIAVVFVGLYLIFPFYPYGFFSRLFLADLYHNRAIAYSKRKIWDEALKEYEKVRRFNPSHIMTHYFMGNVYRDRKFPGDMDKALEKYAQVKKFAPNYVQVHLFEGKVYFYLANRADKEGKKEEAQLYYKEALDDFKKAQALDPVFSPIYIKIAGCYYQLGKYEEAKEILRTALKEKGINFTNHFRADCYMNLANIYFMEKEFKMAEEYYKKAIRLKPDYIIAHRNLAFFYMQIKENERAIVYWKNILHLNPQDKTAIYNLNKLKTSVK